MTKEDLEPSKPELSAPEGLGGNDLSALYSSVNGPRAPLTEAEKELLRELVNALRTIRFGSIMLTVHDGQLVEISKSIRIRKNRRK